MKWRAVGWRKANQHLLEHRLKSEDEEGLLRPPAGRQYRMLISPQPFNRSLSNLQQLLLMSNEGKVENFSSFAYG